MKPLFHLFFPTKGLARKTYLLQTKLKKQKEMERSRSPAKTENLNLQELPREQIQFSRGDNTTMAPDSLSSQLEVTRISFPHNLKDGPVIFKGVFEGFTPSALKSIIIVTRLTIRLFSVRESSITLISSAKINSILVAHFKELTSNSAILVSESKTTILLTLSGNGAIGCRVVFDSKTGQIIAQNIQFYSDDPENGLGNHSMFLKFKNFKSLKENRIFICSESSSAANEFDGQINLQFIRLAKGMAKKWLTLSIFNKNWFGREKRRLAESAKKITSPQDLDADFAPNGFNNLTKEIGAFKFNRTRQNLSLFIAHNELLAFFVLVDMEKRKRLRARCLSVFDLGGSFVEDLINKNFKEEKKQNAEVFLREGPGGRNDEDDQPEAHPRANLSSLMIKRIVYFQNFEGLYAEICHNRSSILVKVTSLFGRLRHELVSKIQKKSNFEEGSNTFFISEFEQNQILLGDRSSFGRHSSSPLSWIDVNTNKKSNVQGLEESPDFSRMMLKLGHTPHEYPKIVPLGFKKPCFVLLNSLSAFVYNYKIGKVEARLDHSLLLDSLEPRMAHLGDLYAINYGAFFYLLKEVNDRGPPGSTSKSSSKLLQKNLKQQALIRKKESEVKMYVFSDLIRDFGRKGVSISFNFIDLKTNRNYLLIFQKEVEEDENSSGLRGEELRELIMLEVDSSTMEIKKIHQKSSLGLGWLSLANIHPISHKYLVFVSNSNLDHMRRDEIQNRQEPFTGVLGENNREKIITNSTKNRNITDTAPEASYRLHLATLGFDMIDICKNSSLRDIRSIAAVSSNRIVSKGELEIIYIHFVLNEQDQPTLVLAKKIEIISGSVLRYPLQRPTPNGLDLLCIPENNRYNEREEEVSEYLALKFNLRSLQFEKAFEIKGLSCPDEVFSLRKQKSLWVSYEDEEAENPESRSKASLYMVDYIRKNILELGGECLGGHVDQSIFYHNSSQSQGGDYLFFVDPIGLRTIRIK